jgi:hypothetical protein
MRDTCRSVPKKVFRYSGCLHEPLLQDLRWLWRNETAGLCSTHALSGRSSRTNLLLTPNRQLQFNTDNSKINTMADQITDPQDGNSPSAHDDSIAPEQRGIKRQRTSNAAPADDDDDDDDKPGRERRKIEIKFIQDKSRRHITFSKRKAGIMKKVRCRSPTLTRDATCRSALGPKHTFTRIC